MARMHPRSPREQLGPPRRVVAGPGGGALLQVVLDRDVGAHAEGGAQERAPGGVEVAGAQQAGPVRGDGGGPVPAGQGQPGAERERRQHDVQRGAEVAAGDLAQPVVVHEQRVERAPRHLAGVQVAAEPSGDEAALGLARAREEQARQVQPGALVGAEGAHAGARAGRDDGRGHRDLQGARAGEHVPVDRGEGARADVDAVLQPVRALQRHHRVQHLLQAIPQRTRGQGRRADGVGVGDGAGLLALGPVGGELGEGGIGRGHGS